MYRDGAKAIAEYHQDFANGIAMVIQIKMKFVLENFKMAGYMAMELTGSQMEANILDNLSKIKSMAMEFISKKMVIFIKRVGR